MLILSRPVWLIYIMRSVVITESHHKEVMSIWPFGQVLVTISSVLMISLLSVISISQLHAKALSSRLGAVSCAKGDCQDVLIHRLKQIDRNCLEALQRNQQDGEASTEVKICIAALDVALAPAGQEKTAFATLMNALRGSQKALFASKAAGDQHQVLTSRNNIGYTLVLLGYLQRSSSILKEAVNRLRRTLLSIDRHRDDALLAATKQNLTFALMTSAAITGNKRHLGEALNRYNLGPTSLDKVDQEPGDAVSPLAEDESEPEYEPDSGFELSLYGSIEVSAVAASNGTLEDDERDQGYSLDVDPEVTLDARHWDDRGFDYGAEVSIDVADISASTSVLHFSGGFGELRFGQDSGAEDDIYIGGGDYQAGSGGIDGNGANLVDVGLTGSNDAVKASYYTPRKRGFQLGVSFTPDTAANSTGLSESNDLDDGSDDVGRFEDHVGLGVNWIGSVLDAEILASAVGSFGQAVAGDNLSSYSLGSGITLGRLGVGAGYTAETSFNDRDLLNFGATYAFDPWFQDVGASHLGAGIALLFPERAASSTVFAISGDMGLAEGLILFGDTSYNIRDEGSRDGSGSTLSSVLGMELVF